MKVVLFCGGLGTRIREYGENVPKPMIPLGSQPILRHIMNYYKDYDHNDFILCMGYKANAIREYFFNYTPLHDGDCVIDNGEITSLAPSELRERVTLIDTGVWRNVGSRLWAVRDHVRNERMFLANYSDGLSDVNLDDMIAKFEASGKVACFLAVHPMATYHIINFGPDGAVNAFLTPDNSEIWINGGFFIFRPEIFNYLNDGEELTSEPFHRLIAEDQLMSYQHTGFWRSMDTLRDRQALEELLDKGRLPWRRNAGESEFAAT
jgi:glucose-1-phosphate cytidylyltransferase